jgi:hypothetical protein
MRFRLHTLMIVVTLGPPLIGGGYWTWRLEEWAHELRTHQTYHDGQGRIYVIPDNIPTGSHWEVSPDKKTLIVVPDAMP